MMCRAFINHALQKLLLVFSTTGSAANLPGPRGHGERRKLQGLGVRGCHATALRQTSVAFGSTLKMMMEMVWNGMVWMDSNYE